MQAPPTPLSPTHSFQTPPTPPSAPPTPPGQLAMLGRGALGPARCPAPLTPPARPPGAAAPPLGSRSPLMAGGHRSQPHPAPPQRRAGRLPLRRQPRPRRRDLGSSPGVDWAASSHRWRRLAVPGTPGRAGRAGRALRPAPPLAPLSPAAAIPGPRPAVLRRLRRTESGATGRAEIRCAVGCGTRAARGLRARPSEEPGPARSCEGAASSLCRGAGSAEKALEERPGVSCGLSYQAFSQQDRLY